MAEPDQAQSAADAASPGRPLAAWLAVATAAFLLYAITAARTIQWQDFGQFTLRIVEGELFNELGLALAHPLHFWLGQLALSALPLQPPHAIAMLSALAGAVTLANVFGCVRSLTRRADAALLAALGLAFANTFWRMSTFPECYTVTTALLSAELWCLALFLRSDNEPGSTANPRWLVAACFFNGLGLANHNLALLTIPVLGIVALRALLRKQIHFDTFAFACLAWFLGASPYIALIGIETRQAGSFVTALKSALFGKHYADEVMSASFSVKLAGISAAFTVLSFFNLTLPLAAAGLWRVAADRARRPLWLAWSAALVIHVLFVLRYNVVDQHTFLLPTYTLVALFAGVGFAALAKRWGERTAGRVFVAGLVLALAAPGVYLAAASLARSQDVLGDMARSKPYRDDYRYLFVPWGAGDTSALRLADHALELAGDDGVVLIGGRMTRFILGYETRQRGLDGVTLFEATPDKPIPWRDWRGRPIVWIPASTQSPKPPPFPTELFTFHDDPPIYILRPAADDASDE